MASPMAPSSETNPIARWGARLRGWIGRHPLVLVALLSPGIVEYLSGSSKLSGLVLFPPLFAVFLLLNLGLYVPGVLLIREAKRRWRGGWGTVILLGTAYAVVEEGLALSTMFNPHAGVVGALGFYGHFLGVSWIWIVGVVAVHVVFSISLPILLLDFALPELRGRPLVGSRGLAAAGVALALTTVVLMLVTARGLGFFAGVPIVAASLLAVAVLVTVAWWLPYDPVRPLVDRPLVSPRALALLGASFWPGMVLLEALFGAAGVPAAVAFVLLVLALAVYATVVLASIGTVGNERRWIALALGLIAPLMVVGAISQAPMPVVLLADVGALLFFRHLWKKYDPAQGPHSLPGRPAAHFARVAGASSAPGSG